MNLQNNNFFNNLRYDLPSSLVVFLVALPLCLGIALASGAPLFSGLIAGIVGGLLVALLSGSTLGVSGPAAGLAVIVFTSIQELGDFKIFLFAVVIGGIIQLLLSFIRAGMIAYYFPSGVIKGMLAGIGILIILKQIPHAVGYDKDPEGDFTFFQKDGHNTISELFYMLDFVHSGVIIITLVSMVVLFLWERPFMKKLSITKIIQGPLAIVLAGIAVNSLLNIQGDMAINKEHLVNIPVSDSFIGFFQQFSFPDFTAWKNPQVYLVALTIAVVASLETLLCVEATDKLDPEKRVTPPNRELFAQGIGNMVSGFIGGLPVTQVIVRSSANIQSGAKSKASAFFHGLLLLLCVMAIPTILNRIPLASLAVILFMVGYKLARPSLFRELYIKGKDQFIPFMVTILGIVFTDLLTGIGLGLLVAIFEILWNSYKKSYHFDLDTYQEGTPIKIQLSEDVTFLHKVSIQRTLDRIPKGAHVILDGSKTKNLHTDVLEIIKDFKDRASNRNIKVEIYDLNFE